MDPGVGGRDAQGRASLSRGPDSCALPPVPGAQEGGMGPVLAPQSCSPAGMGQGGKCLGDRCVTSHGPFFVLDAVK